MVSIVYRRQQRLPESVIALAEPGFLWEKGR
jgi:hypothetical protein